MCTYQCLRCTRKISEHIGILTGIAVGEEMTDERRAKKADRFLQESESAHDDALRNLQGDVRLAEKFDELEKQSDKKRADPFFYTLRRKRTDASALKTEDASDRTTARGLGPEPSRPHVAPSSELSSEPTTTTVDASSDAAPQAAPSSEPIPLRVAPPATNRRSALAALLILVVLGGAALAYVLTRSPEMPERRVTSSEIPNASSRPGRAPPIASTSVPIPPTAPTGSAILPTAVPTESASVAPPVKTSAPTKPPVAATSSVPPIKTSTPVGSSPVY